jgi:UDP-2,3-diacylglucosamine pyrophosphatase LpxH
MKAEENIQKREVEILVISDIHLGTYGCHAKELNYYLKTISPKKVILNGDIIDIWQFNKRYWPKSHMKIIKHILNWSTKGVEVYYITGNHDELLRKFVGFEVGTLKVVNKVILELANGEKAWFFHGDVFDITMQHSKWLAKLGAIGYDSLIIINRLMNFISEKILKKGKISLSKKIKSSVKSAVKFVNQFETVAAEIGCQNNYDYVCCGHIHQPEMREITTKYGKIQYLNSGDWIENLTALEYNNGKWKVYKYSEDESYSQEGNVTELEMLSYEKLFSNLASEFNLMKQIVQ